MQAVFTSLNKSSLILLSYAANKINQSLFASPASARRGLTGYGQADGLVCGLNYDNYEIA